MNKIINLLPKHQPHKMVKHTQTIRRLSPTNCLSGFDHFVGLVLKGLKPKNEMEKQHKQRKSELFTILSKRFIEL